MEMTLTAELVADARSEVGEGPVWDGSSSVLRWVDVLAGILHTYDPATGVDSALDLHEPVGFVAERASGGLVIGTPRGFIALDPDQGVLTMLAEVEADDPATRMNDGKVDPTGRLWAGTTGDGASPSGTLYRFDPDGTVTPVLSGVTVSNGLAWSPDGATFYYIDTPTTGVDAFDFDACSGAVANRRRLVDLPSSEFGFCDGMTVDADGHLWVATWGTGTVRRFAPDGSPDVVVSVPVTQPSSCTFGGSDLGDLYITTARYEMTPEALALEPVAGGLFRCRPGVTGLPMTPFAG